MESSVAPSNQVRFKELTDVITDIDATLKDELLVNCGDVWSLQDKFKVICLIGVTGQGKSSVGNSICKKKVFAFSAGTASLTSAVKGVLTNFKGDPQSEKIIVLDTPGFGDSKKRDSSFIKNIVASLRNVGYVNTFLIIINSQNPRFDDQLATSIKLFIEMFSPEFIKNIMICCTRYSVDEKSELEREEGVQLGKEQIAEALKHEFYERFQHQLTDDQFVFIDNTVFIMKNKEFGPEETEFFEAQLQNILDFTCKQQAFRCLAIKEALQEHEKKYERRQQELERRQQELDRRQQELESKLLEKMDKTNKDHQEFIKNMLEEQKQQKYQIKIQGNMDKQPQQKSNQQEDDDDEDDELKNFKLELLKMALLSSQQQLLQQKIRELEQVQMKKKQLEEAQAAKQQARQQAARQQAKKEESSCTVF